LGKILPDYLDDLDDFDDLDDLDYPERYKRNRATPVRMDDHQDEDDDKGGTLFRSDSHASIEEYT